MTPASPFRPHSAPHITVPIGRTAPARSGECAVRSGECAVHSGECAVHSGECAVHSGECAVHGGAARACEPRSTGSRLVREAEAGLLELWLLGSSGGESAQVAGSRGLPFAANYHVAPASVLEAVSAYRAALRPGALREPYVMVSADEVVAPDDETARELALPYGLWVHSIRTG